MNYKILKKLIHPITVEEFFNEYWEKKVLYIPRNDYNYYEDILTLSDVNEYLSQTDIRYPHVRLVKNGSEIPLIDYSYNFVYGENSFQGVIDMDKLFYLYNEGATMSFQLLQKSIRKLSLFSNSIEKELEFPTQTNLFLTPPKSQGFTAHYDTHSFFIIHLHGEKQWKIYEESKALPLLKERVYDVDVEIKKPPILEPILKPGDFMYVPRGIYHEANSNDSTTLQITLGLFTKIWHDILHEAVDEITDLNIDFRKGPNPIELKDKQYLIKHFQKLLDSLRDVEPDKYFENGKEKTFSNQIHDTENRLKDLVDIENITSNTIFSKRPIKVSTVKKENSILLKVYDKIIEFPDFVENELNSIISLDYFKSSDLKGELDIEEKLVLLKKLVIEGVLRVK